MYDFTIGVEPRLHLFGAAVRAARHERGWTQSDLAQRVGIGIVTVMKIEGGSAGVAFGTVLQLCSVLNLSPDPDRIASTPAQQRNLKILANRRKRVRKPLIDSDLEV